jgi:hypothetical protein
MVFDSKLGKVVLFGGYTYQFDMMNDTWEWDGTSKTWTQQLPANSPSPRSATLAYDATSNQVILFGGFTTGYVYYGDTWTYNGVDWVQQQPATMPPGRTDNGLAFDPVLKSVVLFGGLANASEGTRGNRLNDTWLWSGENWTEVQTHSSPERSSGVSLTFDGNVEGMLLFGGWLSPNEFTSETWVFGIL